MLCLRMGYVKILAISIDWSKYNQELVMRGEMLPDLSAFVSAKEKLNALIRRYVL